ncbi:hypothetical protein VAC51_00009 [Variovorax phage VAC_51]|uniref:Uncharacterized protein n=1 Tax=Variovorax phage VAC_51 TaxID=2985242 RepID=A0A9N6ZF54_9CAUD|nr:hypothetical protein VAC51_00009 [Variovorax phage VAC_51]
MALQNRTSEQRLYLANALARAEALVRNNVQAGPVNYPTDVQAALVAAKTVLDLAVAA